MIVRTLLLAALLLPTVSFADTTNKTIDLLKDGTLDAFYTFIRDRGKNVDPKDVFTMQDGMLVISGEEWGCVTTKASYKNYHLVAEFKWAGKTWEPRLDRARDSGILVHSQGEDGGYNGTWMHGLEVQMIEGGTGDLLAVGDGSEAFMLTAPVAEDKQGGSWIYHPDGKLETINGGRINWYARDPEWEDVVDFYGDRDVEHPVGEWNTLECIAVGQTISVILNGVLVNQAVDVMPREGRIQVQAEGAEVHFRKLALTPLAPKGDGKEPPK
jgi:hypothetical protein